MLRLPSVLDVGFPAGLSTTITSWSSYKTGKGNPAFAALIPVWLISIMSPGFSLYECKVTGLSFILILPLCRSFLILVLGESGYCSSRNSISVIFLFKVIFNSKYFYFPPFLPFPPSPFLSIVPLHHCTVVPLLIFLPPRFEALIKPLLQITVNTPQTRNNLFGPVEIFSDSLRRPYYWRMGSNIPHIHGLIGKFKLFRRHC